MLITSRITPHMCDIGKLSILTTRKESTRAEFMKRIMKEQHQCFGALLETKKKKIRRLKLQKKGKLLQKDSNTNDSELPWIMKISHSRLKRIKLNVDQSIPLVPEKEFAAKTGPAFENVSPKRTQTKMFILEGKPIARYANHPRLPSVQIKIYKSCSTEKTSVNNFNVAVADRGVDKIINLPKLDVFPKSTSNNGEFQEVSKGKPTESCQIFNRPKDNKINLAAIKTIPQRAQPLPLILSPQDILRNINEAQLFAEGEQKNFDDLSRAFEFPVTSIPQNAAISRLPSVTKILYLTMSDERKKSHASWISEMIDELRQKDFAACRRDVLENGKLLRSLIGDWLKKLPLDVPVRVRPSFNGIQSILKEVNNVRAIESQVVHHELGYRGTLDCVASFRGNLCLIDWKQSFQPKNLWSTPYDAPLEIASYIGALNADKHYPFQVKSGALVIAYTTGNEPTVYVMDEAKLQKYWNLWIKRLKKYYEMQIS